MIRKKRDILKRVRIRVRNIGKKKVAKRKVARRKKKISQKPEPYFSKLEENPVILPRAEHRWESWQTFNPGAILLNGKVHFLYRAIGDDGISRLGYAVSGDGFRIDERLPYPVYRHCVTSRQFNYISFASGGSWGGCEDPRIVRVGDEDTLYMTYTACDGGLGVGLTSIRLDDFLNRRWDWKKPKLISRTGEVHKNWVIFPEKINGKYAILHSVSPRITIEYLDDLEFGEGECIESCYDGSSEECKDCWHDHIRAVGPPPIKTNDGWLVLYHANPKEDHSKYKVGAMLLDFNDPTKVLYYSKEPILEPDRFYENEGFKAGIVYASGAVVKDGNLVVYYGGADSYVCAAYTGLEEFLDTLKKDAKPELKKAVKVKKKKQKYLYDKR